MNARSDAAVAALEAQADAAEQAMYDAHPRLAKDHKDDALALLRRAADAARRSGLDAEAARLDARIENLIAVWDRQFRGVGY
ncbi:MAG TPA: hypothetical protein VKT30_02980 [Caulobacteraceae bacterium]|nr:hypothetical protein [Caulobacteraceae bacterium]